MCSVVKLGESAMKVRIITAVGLVKVTDVATPFTASETAAASAEPEPSEQKLCPETKKLGPKSGGPELAPKMLGDDSPVQLRMVGS